MNALALVAAALSAELSLADFEGRVDPSFSANRGELAHYHSTGGVYSLRVPSTPPAFELSSRVLPPDWRAFEALRLDVFSLGTLRVSVKLEDASGRAVELSRRLDPGRGTFEVDLDSLEGKLDLGKVARLWLAVEGPECFIDRLRLFAEREREVKLLRAFDFGKRRFRAFEAWEDAPFSAEAGAGWLEGSKVHCSGLEWPDALARDGVEGEGVFAVSVPNGIYGVWRLVEAGWSLPESAPRERSKGGPWDAFGRRWKESSEELVAGRGRVEVKLSEGEKLCAFSVFPTSETEAAGKWLKVVRRRMRRAFEQAFRPAARPPRPRMNSTHRERRRGYILYRRPADELFPERLPGDEDRFDCILMDCARGELTSEHFAVLALSRVSTIRVEVEDFCDSQGVPSGGEVRVGWVQYAQKRLTPGSREYGLRGEFITPGPVVPLGGGLPRDVWLWVRAPDRAGRHVCRLRLVPDKGLATTVELVVRVATFALPPASRTRLALGLPRDARAARWVWEEMLARGFNAGAIGPGASGILRSLRRPRFRPGLLVRGQFDPDATVDWELAPSGALLVDAAKTRVLPGEKEVIITGLPATRAAWGIGAYSLRARAGARWFRGPELQRISGDPYFDFDGPRGDECLLYPLSEGCLRTPPFEEMCLGMTDLLYLRHLESLCERAAKLAPGETRRARRFLERVVKAGTRDLSTTEL